MIRRALDFTIRLSERGEDHDARSRAASLAFYVLLALFPTMLGLLGLLSFFDLTDEIHVLNTAMSTALPPDAAAMVQTEVSKILRADLGRPLTLSLLFTIYYAGRAMGIAIRGVHEAWGVQTRRRWLWVRVMGGALAGAMLLLVVLVLWLPRLVIFVLEGLESLAGLDYDTPSLLLHLQYPLMVLTYQQAVNALYRAGQRLQVGWGWWSWGSLLACGVWMGLSQLFGLYLERFSNLGATYGSLGAAVGLLIYVHVMSWGLFMGAELDAMLYAERDRRRHPPGEAGARR